MGDYNKKWQANAYINAKKFCDNKDSIKVTERNQDALLKQAQAISEAYVQLYEEKYGVSGDTKPKNVN